MFGNCLIEMAAHAAGLTDQQLAVIEKELPACRKLIDLVVKAKPLIDKAAPIINDAEPIITEATPLVNEAIPLVKEALVEIKAIQPAINIVLGVVQRDLAAGHSIAQSFNNVSKRIQATFQGSSPWA